MSNKKIFFKRIVKYCQQVEYGEIFIKFKIHRGQISRIEEFKAPLRLFPIDKEENEEQKNLDKPIL